MLGLKITKQNISKIIQWSPSRYNMWRKHDVVKLAMEILLKGEGREVFTSGNYTEAGCGICKGEYLVDGPSRSIQIGEFISREEFRATETFVFLAPKSKAEPRTWNHEVLEMNAREREIAERHGSCSTKCKNPTTHFVCYCYITGKAGRTSSAMKRVCKEHAEKFASKYHVAIRPMEETEEKPDIIRGAIEAWGKE